MRFDAADYLNRLEPPRYAAVDAIVCDSLTALRPPRRIDVPTWAEQERQVASAIYNGPWRNDFAPYMVEPSRLMTSRKFGAVVFVGPARTVKSESLILNTIGHRAMCMPRDMLVVTPTKETAREFSITKLGPMLRHNPTVRAQQETGRSADNIFDKLFRGAMRLRIAHPVIGELSMKDIPDVLFTDYDRMTDDVDGEGAPFDLGRKRTQGYFSLGMVAAESSPGRPVEVDDWKPQSPHEAPPCGGLLGIYNTGTRGQRYWICDGCREPFRPVFANLHWEDRGSHGETAKTVEMLCPHCGQCHPPDRKRELDMAGIWLHETAPSADGGFRLVEIDDPDIRETDVASYWCEGPIAALQNWSQLVSRHLDAKAQFDATGDETRLKATITLDQGRPYVPRVRAIGEGLNAEALKALSGRYPMEIVPAAARFLTVQVDVQTTKFVVAVDAWGPGLERWLIARFDIIDPPADAPGADQKRSLNPPAYAEDWSVLAPLLEHVWPVEGGEFGLKPVAMIVDSGGAPGTTKNAYGWLRRMRGDGYGRRAFILKGVGGVDRDRAVYVEPEKVEGSRRRGRSTDLRIVRAGTDTLKDEIAVALMRKDAGPGKYHLPESLADSYLEEFCAELRTPKGWKPKRHGARNESLDLAVYGKALAIILRAERIDWDNPFPWASPPADNPFATGSDGVAPVTPHVETPAVAPARGRRMLSRGV